VAGHPAVAGVKTDEAFKRSLSEQSIAFRLIFDVETAQKHIELDRGRPRVVHSADQVSVRSLGYGQASYGEGRWGSPPQVVVALNDGTNRVLDAIANEAISFLTSKLDEFGF
jgi:hypothetical protein